MKDPILVIMAAGMGSRYGGLKQIDAMDEYGHIMMDFSIYDAYRAGFKKVVFIIKRELHEIFREVIGKRIEQYMDVKYVYQELGALPNGYSIPEGRVKPWGTAHAILCCNEVVDAPFAVINADDYYGSHAFQLIYDFLKKNVDSIPHPYAMVGYKVENTLTENGHVARGVCAVDDNNHLTAIRERTRIERQGDSAAYTEDEGKSWVSIPHGATVSMNLWGFNESILTELKTQFTAFLDENLSRNPLKCEYFLPDLVGNMIKKETATVEVLKTEDKWYGVTYKEDRENVVNALQNFKNQGLYPQTLWGDKR